MRTQRCNSIGGFDIVTMRLIHGYLAQGDDLPIEKMFLAPGVNVYDYVTNKGIHAITCYALTEASNVVALGVLGSDYQHSKYANGRPLPGVEVKIADYETGEPVPPDTAGEICFRGWNTMLGYHRLPKTARRVFDPEGYLHTGDYGWLDEQGWLYFRGRYAMMIKTGGENVSEIEVENFLMSECPGVKQAAVVGAPDPRWDEIVVAFVEFADHAEGDLEKLRESCRGRLARYKVPKTIFRVAPGEWPVTPTGKIKKADLREWAQSRLKEGAVGQGSSQEQE
jgi:fatty-acyl-CoA synthase